MVANAHASFALPTVWDRLIKATEKYITGQDDSAPNPHLFQQQDFRWDSRRLYTIRFGFVALTPRTLSAVAAAMRGPTVSVGCGPAALERGLRTRHGRPVVCTNKHRPTANPYGFRKEFEPVEYLSGAAAVRKYPDHDVLVSWPTYKSSWPIYVARAMAPGRRLLYIGEDAYGCTATPAFYDHMAKAFERERDAHITQWYGIHDYLTVWRKK